MNASDQQLIVEMKAPPIKWKRAGTWSESSKRPRDAVNDLPVEIDAVSRPGPIVGLAQSFQGSNGRDASYARDFAQAAEELGFDSIWVPEHAVLFDGPSSDYPYGSVPGAPVLQRPFSALGLYEPLLLCQALALATSRLRWGTAVVVLPLRHPLQWARQVSTLDHFCDGRFDFGVGVGWLREEFLALNL